MNTTSFARASIGALAFTVLAGCGGSTNFTIEKTFTINGVGAQHDTQNINLADLAGDAWDHRDKIKDATINTVTAKVTKVYGAGEAPANTTTSVSGDVTISRGTPVTFASGTNVTVAQDAVYAVPAANLDPTAKLIKDALKGDGKFDLTTNATPAGGTTTHIDVTVFIDVDVEWSLF